MESNITDQQFWSSDPTLAEPHFDQEATLRSAQPVVPIDAISEKAGFSRPWLVGLALVGTLLLGSLVTAIYYSRFTATNSPTTTEAETVSSGVAGIESDLEGGNIQPKLPAETTKLENSSEDSDNSARIKPRTESPSATSRNSARPVVKIADRRRVPVVVEADPDSDHDLDERRREEIRDQRRAARREAKEQKRGNRQRRSRKNGDGVLRIREIFEGAPRP